MPAEGDLLETLRGWLSRVWTEARDAPMGFSRRRLVKNLIATRPAAQRSTLSISSTLTTILRTAAGSARAADQPAGTTAGRADQPMEGVVLSGIRERLECACG